MIHSHLDVLKGYQYAILSFIKEEDSDCIHIHIRLDDRSINKLKLITGQFSEHFDIYIRGLSMYKLVEEYRMELKVFENGSHSCLVPIGLTMSMITKYSPDDPHVNTLANIYNPEHDIKVVNAHISSHQKIIKELQSAYNTTSKQ